MTDETDHGRPDADPPIRRSGTAMTIPELVVVESVAEVMAAFGDGDGDGDGAGNGSEQPVSDDERNRYGRLLDRAAERGLLSPAEYRARLHELADATTVDQMREIVTELPLLDGAATRAPGRSRSTGRAPSPGEVPLPMGTQRRRSSPWFVLVVVIVALVLAMVFFALYADHLAHATKSSAAAWPQVNRWISALRS